MSKWIAEFELKDGDTEHVFCRINKEYVPKIGHWINQHVIYANATIDFKVCSECRYELSYDAETGVSDANYCPNCGCRMVESQESEE